MNTSRTSFRVLLCALASMAAAAITSATTITYSGLVDFAVFDSAASGDPWQLIVVLPDPLTDTSGGANAGDFLYMPSSVSFAVNGVTRVADFNYSRQFEGVHGYQGRYGNAVTAMAYDGGAGIQTIALGLGSETVTTQPDGLLLATSVMGDFADNRMWFRDYTTNAYIGGWVTAYSVETGSAAVPDAAPTLILLGLAILALVLLQRWRHHRRT